MKNSEESKIIEHLKAEIAATRKKLNELENSLIELEGGPDVFSVPEALRDLFLNLQSKFEGHFRQLQFNPEKGELTLNGERYILLRSSSLSYDFFQALVSLFKKGKNESAFNLASDLLYEIAHIIGKSDAKYYHKNLKLKDPHTKLAAGPVHFAYTGWAYVDISEDSIPVASDEYFLKYKHKRSFEADAWLNSGEIPQGAVCAMSAGYSSGWCEESYGIELAAVEINCRAVSEGECEFIMAPPHKINSYLPKELQKKSELDRLFEKNIFQRQLAEKKRIIERVEKFSNLGTWTYYFNNSNLTCSNEVYEIFEISKNIKKTLFNHILKRLEHSTLDGLRNKIEISKQAGIPFELRHFINCPSGKVKFLVSNGEPIYSDKLEVIGFKGVVQDITKHTVSDRELDHFFNLSIDLQCIANAEGYFVKISPSWSKLLGYSKEELLSRPYLDFVHPDDREKTVEEAERLNQENMTFGFENRYITKSGRVVVLKWNSTYDALTKLFYCTVHDVTQQKEDKEKLLTDLSEKEILLREIHHRVKNNLQVISSLLSLQSGMRSDQPELVKLYTDSQNRIKSMAAIHEMFYKSKNLDKIDFERYLTKLISDLIHSYNGNTNNIALKIKSELLFLDLDTAIPLGLIINEIITNALKHGIQTGKKGSIFIDFKRINQDQLQLIIGDDGEGMEAKFDMESSETLGMMLITSLIEQVNGTIELMKKKKGTYYKIIFEQS
ncbi:MAG: histidine kinase dimerization/phosphoacceptor domain -containing protein [Brumimicrobium sp.]|nr:histidine kinase dimerization/phosphoacceptor domain -containing protein [Brumimicrobium sp.]